MLEGDESQVGTASAALGSQLFEAMSSDTAGPGALEAEEREAVDSFLGEITNGAEGLVGLLDQPTWARVYDVVRRENPGLFNALNLATLQTHRPAPLEAPAECERFRPTVAVASYLSLPN